MMKIAIAGTNGFAQYIAYSIQNSTPHQTIILSRRPNVELSNRIGQVMTTNYQNVNDLAFHLEGVDIVISTIAGPAQLRLIAAAAAAGVRRFVPSEFGGSPPSRRPDEPTDDQRCVALAELQRHQANRGMQYTVFNFGVFYERFARNALAGSQINVSRSLGGAGSFLVNIAEGRAMMPQDPTGIGRPDPNVFISMISARDAARFVVAALERPLQSWPNRINFSTERLSLYDILQACQSVNHPIFDIAYYDPANIRRRLQSPSSTQAEAQEARQMSQLLAVGENRFDLSRISPSAQLPIDYRTYQRFAAWLHTEWAGS